MGGGALNLMPFGVVQLCDWLGVRDGELLRREGLASARPHVQRVRAQREEQLRRKELEARVRELLWTVQQLVNSHREHLPKEVAPIAAHSLSLPLLACAIKL